MSDPMAWPESRRLFSLLFSPIKSDRRRCDEDQLTAALAACCRVVPELAVFLADQLFQTPIALPHWSSIVTQYSEHVTIGGRAFGLRYDLLLGAAPGLPQRGLVLEHKIEATLSAYPVEQVPGIPEELTQVEMYLCATAKWLPAVPRVGAIVKYPQDRPIVAMPDRWGGGRWAGAVTWNQLDAALDEFPLVRTDVTARQIVVELKELLREMHAVMQLVPAVPSLADGELISQLFVSAISALGSGYYSSDGRAAQCWRYVDRKGAANRVTALSFRPGRGIYLCLDLASGSPHNAERMRSLGYVPDDYPSWDGGRWYRRALPLPFDFATHTTFDGQLVELTRLLREALAPLWSAS